ncbi:carboxylate--amine ligase [Woodsholea maritima]|uniref:carboxylate--amine ligase n=1 Tax=Woodsholea maritima TaxID=240237 RepID=UPI0003753129|nr:ATP-grasp domain-containing protein [Woodsholea maritima]
MTNDLNPKTDPKHEGRVIVTYGRSLMALVIAHSLHKRGVEVITCDSVGLTAGSFSRYSAHNFVHADYEKDEEGFIQDLLKAVLKHKPVDERPYILMPTFREAKVLALHKHRFEGLITLAVADIEAIDKVDPKQNLVKTLDGLDVPAPKTWHPHTRDEVRAVMAEIKMPALIKAVDEVGGRGIEFFDDPKEMQTRALQRVGMENPPPLLQEGAKGEDYCVCVLYKDGQLRAHMAYHNVQNMPVAGGSGAMRETVDDAPFLRAANALMDHVGWHGVAEIDFMWDPDSFDQPKLIEVNPRFWAGLFQSVESGVDFPWLVYHLFAYGDVPAGEEVEGEVGAKTRVPGAWAAGAFADALDGIDTKGAGKAWDNMVWELEKGEPKAAFKSFAEAVDKVTDFDEAFHILKQRFGLSKGAKSEIDLHDDPMSAFGVLFVLSSLVRHGELPHELKG